MFSSKDTITSKPSFQRLKKSQEDSEKKSAPLIQKIIRGKIARTEVNKMRKEMKKEQKRVSNLGGKKKTVLKTNVSKKENKKNNLKKTVNTLKTGNSFKGRKQRQGKQSEAKRKFILKNILGQLKIEKKYQTGIKKLDTIKYTIVDSVILKEIAKAIYNYHKQRKAKYGSTSLSVMEIDIMNNYGNIKAKQIRRLQGGQGSYELFTDDVRSVRKGIGNFIGRRAKGAKQTIRNLRNKIDTAFDPTPGLKNNTCYKGVQNIITLHKQKKLTEKKLEDKEIEELEALKKAINDFNCKPGKKMQIKLFENQISRVLKRGTKVYRDGKNRFTSRLFNKPTKDKTTADYLLKKLIKKKKKEGKRGKKSSTAGSTKSLKLKF